MNTKVLTLKADKIPMDGIEYPNSNQLYKNPRLEVEERNLGELDSNKIRVKMLYVGVCGSDIHVHKRNPNTGYISSSVPVNIPKEGRIIGHEGVGKVLDVGDNVKHIKKDNYVTLESIQVCNNCAICKRGDFNQCRSAKLVGLEIDGIMGSVVDVDANLAHNISSYIRSEEDLIAMACVEPAGVAYDACENGRVRVGDVLTIFGAGPIGLYTAMLAKNVYGVSRIYIVEPVEFRRNLAKKYTEYVYECKETLRANIQNIDIVVETSGHLDNIEYIFDLLDANSRIVLLARSGEKLQIKSVDHMITNNISIIGSRGHLCGAFDKLLRVQSEQIIDLKSIVTTVVDGVEKLKYLLDEGDFEERNCKAVVKI